MPVSQIRAASSMGFIVCKVVCLARFGVLLFYLYIFLKNCYLDGLDNI